MKQIFGRALMAATLLATAAIAEAAITCTSITSTGFSTAFSGTVPPTNITPAFFTVTCNRNLAGDPTTVTYDVGVNNGLNPVGNANRAALAGSFVRYEPYKDSACAGTTWKSTGGNRITDTMTLSGFVATQKNTSYWGCIVLSAAVPAGIYTDTVTMTLTYPGGSIGNTFPVNIATPSTCAFAAPATLSFTYTAFGPAATASVSFNPTCTIYLAYSMALDATVGVVNGLKYDLALNTVNSGGSSPLASTGTGAAQTFYVNGTMPALQAGTCATVSCSGATSTRTLTITY